jgi:hypothetical protein
VENEAPCLRPEEDIKHSRSEQVVASMDPKRPRRGWIGTMLPTFPEMTSLSSPPVTG